MKSDNGIIRQNTDVEIQVPQGGPILRKYKSKTNKLKGKKNYKKKTKKQNKNKQKRNKNKNKTKEKSTSMRISFISYRMLFRIINFCTYFHDLE